MKTSDEKTHIKFTTIMNKPYVARISSIKSVTPRLGDSSKTLVVLDFKQKDGSDTFIIALESFDYFEPYLTKLIVGQ